MIKIVKANELEGEWFEGRSFGTTNETVHSIIEDVAANGDSALKNTARNLTFLRRKHF